MPRLRMYEVIWDEGNLNHATRRATVWEIEQVLFNGDTIVRANTARQTADYLAYGETQGGRRLVVAFVYDSARSTVRPITAWEA